LGAAPEGRDRPSSKHVLAADGADGRCRHQGQYRAHGAQHAPILPLDGGRIAVSLLPNRLAFGYARLEPFGFPILLLLIFTNVLGVIMLPMVRASIGLIETIFQL
jgi:hypothetical protein